MSAAEALKAEGETQESIAVRLGVARNTVSDWFTHNVATDNMRTDNRVGGFGSGRPSGSGRAGSRSRPRSSLDPRRAVRARVFLSRERGKRP